MALNPKSAAVLALAALAALVYLYFLASALSSPWLEPLAQGVTAIMALIAYLVLWLLILPLLLLTALNAVMPDWMKIGAFVAHIVAGAGVICALVVGLGPPGDEWMLGVAVLTPLLIAVPAVAAALRGRAGRVSALAGALAVLLSLPPMVMVAIDELSPADTQSDDQRE